MCSQPTRKLWQHQHILWTTRNKFSYKYLSVSVRVTFFTTPSFLLLYFWVCVYMGLFLYQNTCSILFFSCIQGEINSIHKWETIRKMHLIFPLPYFTLFQWLSLLETMCWVKAVFLSRVGMFKSLSSYEVLIGLCSSSTWVYAVKLFHKSKLQLKERKKEINKLLKYSKVVSKITE